MPQLETLGNVLTCALVIAAVLIVPVKLARVWLPVLRAKVMSREKSGAPSIADTSAVHVPIPNTDTGVSTVPETDDIINDRWPAGISTRDPDHVIITYLAVQKRSDGSYRFSANEIYTLVKHAPRADVLRQIKEIREGPPKATYREYTPEEQAVLANS